MKIFRNQNDAENPIRTVRSEDKNKVREKVLVARNIIRQGRTVGEWRRQAATRVRKDKARMGSSRTFAPLPQATRGTMWKRGVACVPRQLPRKRSTSQVSHTSPSKKKRLNLIQHQALPRLRSDTQVYSRGPTCLPSCLNI